MTTRLPSWLGSLLLSISLVSLGSSCTQADDKKPEAEGETPATATTDDATPQETAQPESTTATTDKPEAQETAAPAGETQEVDASGLKLALPKAWQKEQPSSNMREAQFRVSDPDDAEKSAEFVVFKFGPSPISENIKRWIGQYRGNGRTVKAVKGKAPQGEYVVVELSGTHMKSVGPPINRKTVDVPNSRTIHVALIVPDQAMYFLKLVGPDELVASQRDKLRAAFGADASSEEDVEL